MQKETPFVSILFNNYLLNNLKNDFQKEWIQRYHTFKYTCDVYERWISQEWDIRIKLKTTAFGKI